ncbi:sigma-70 family RNA polymerase sigma factor [Thalassobacillus sp. CUG 92003]|uniref:sigma-70 family RNA polymerase sigma factor n=1 Tax=Thalassobacillus sp. CUG 92003 TaxID=2736641 RepID=UPI0015E66E8C|nr:sigma-70 family RNA polymerase sigma factor [Thalassobacillus sp. CUG 92003]
MDNQSLDAIYQSYMLDIYRYLLSLCRDPYLTEDLVQETFFRAYLHIEDIDEKKIKPWLFSVAYHAFIDIKRKEKHSTIKEESFFQKIAETDSLEKKVILNEQLREVEQIIYHMDEKQRQAILLVDFNQLSYKEAASVISVNLSHLKILLFRARQAIRQQSERSEFDE